MSMNLGADNEDNNSFRSLAENLPGIVYRVLLEDDNRTIFFNDMVQTMTGYSPEDLKKGKVCSIDPLILSEDRLNVINIVKDAIENNVPFEVEYRINNKSGELRWFFERGRPVKGDSGKPSYIDGIIFDITKRKEAEKKLETSLINALKNSEEKYKTLFEQTPMAKILVNFERKIEDCNKSMEDLFGYTKEELLGIDFLELDNFHLDTKLKLAKSFSRFLKTGVPEQSEIQMYRKDGKMIWISTYPINVKIAEKSYILGVIQDITERKKLMEELRVKNLVFNVSISAQSTTDINGIINLVNPAFLEMWGYKSKEEAIGNSVGSFFANPDDAVPVFEALNETGKWEGEFLAKRSDGSTFISQGFASAIHNENGDLVGFQSANLDITKRKKAEEKYRHVFENNPYYIILLDKEGIYIDCNDRTVDIYGYPKEDLLGKNFKEMSIVPPEVLQLFENRIELLIKGEILPPIEFEPIRKDGKQIWINSQASLIKLDNELFVYIIGQDITERKKAELKLKIEKENAQKYLDIAGVIIVAVNANQTVQLINRKGCEILEEQESKIIGRNWFDNYIPENVRKQVKITFNRILSGEIEPLENYENAVLTKNGKERIISWYNHTLRNDAGQIIGTLSSGLDITEKKKAEHKMRESEEKYRSFVENFQGIAFQGYEDYSIEFFHGAVKEITGYTPEDFTSGRIKWNQLFITEDISEFQEQEFEKNSRTQIEYKIKAKDGTTHWILSKTQKFYDEIKKQMGGRGIFIDITDKKKAEQQLKESEEKFRTIADQSFIGILIIQDNQIKYVNDALLNTFEYSQKEITNWEKDDLTKLINSEDLSFLREYREHLRSGDKSLKPYYSYRVLTKSGKMKWIDQFSKEILYRGKSAELITIMDITEKKEAEQQLKESEEKFRTIAEQSFMGIIIIQEGLFKYFNQRAADINGYSVEEIQNWKPYEFAKLIHPEDREFVMEQVRKKQDGEIESINHHTYRLVKKSGEIAWMDNYSKTINYKGRLADLVMTEDITDKIIAEEQLKESEEKFRNIADQSLMGIAILQDDVYKYINRAYVTATGYSEEEMLNWIPGEYKKLVHPDFVPLVLEQARKKQQGEKDVKTNYQFKGIKKDGQEFWAELYSKTINYNGRPADLITRIDRTDRIIAEEALKESEQKFRTISEQSLMGIGILQDEELKYINKKYADMFGYSVEEFIGKTFSEFLKLIHPEDRGNVIKKVEKRKDRTGDTITYYQFRSFKKSGELFWADVYSRLITYQGKRASLLIILDITEMKIAELKLKESEEKFRKIAEQTYMGIIIRQHDKVNYVNDAAINIFGYSIEEVQEWTNEYITEKFAHPEDLSYLRDNRRIEREGDSEIKHNLSYRIITKSGKLRWIDQYSKIILYQGEISELITIVDITEKKEAERLIIEENRKLLELDKIRKDFLIRASHELKTPLNSVYSTSEFLIHYHEEKLDENLKKFLEIIYKGGKRLKLLIENLLDVSRIESEKFELNIAEKNIRKILKNCINEVYYLSKRRNISIIFEKSEDILLNLDKIRIEQVFVNILVNAIKNTPNYGEVTIKTLQENGKVKITFIDTGVGFTEEEKGKIFKKFGKIERYGQGMDIDTEGSGLGLFLSKEIVELHGGKIEFKSDGRNKGSTFFIELPISIN